VDIIEAGGLHGTRFGPEAYDVSNEALAQLRIQVRQQVNEVSGRYQLTGLNLPRP